MAGSGIPHFRIYADGEPIPPVDPEDIKRVWKLIPPWGPGNDQQSACSPGADVSAVTLRKDMIDTLDIHKLLTPWKHGNELDDAVFRIAATFPVHGLTHRRYRIEGDEIHGFDPNAFVQQLIEETGIQHVWEPVPTRVPKDGLLYSYSSVQSGGQARHPERDAKQQARQLLWEIWKRFAPSLNEVISHSDKEHASEIVASFFADYLIANIDLVRQVEDGFRKDRFPQLAILKQLEQKAQSWPRG